MVSKSVAAVVLVALSVGWMLQQTRAETPADTVFNNIYYIADLPVWRLSAEPKAAPEFDAKILIAYLKASVTPDSWSEKIEIRPFNSNGALVISHTSAGHEKIADLLTELRPAATGEIEERVGKTASEKTPDP